jgi:hypothetical protein
MTPLIKIYAYDEFSTPSIHKWVVGELLSNPTVGPVYSPLTGFNYYPINIRAKGYRIGSQTAETIWFTPFFFQNYENYFLTNPWYVDILTEGGSLIWRGIIDPDSIEFDFRTRETTFTAVNPFYVIEKAPPFGTRNVYAIKPSNIVRSLSGSTLNIAFDVPKNSNYDSWITGIQFIEYDGGFMRVQSVEDQTSFWRIIGTRFPVEKTFYVSGKITTQSINKSNNTIKSVTYAFTQTLNIDAEWSRIDSGSIVISNNEYFFADFTLQEVDDNGTRRPGIRINLSSLSLSASNFTSGTIHTLKLYIHKKEGDLSSSFSEIYLLGGTNFFGATADGPNYRLHEVVAKYLTNIAAPFSTYQTPSFDETFHVRPETVLSENPKETIEGLLNLGPIMLYCEPTTNAHFKLTFKKMPSATASAVTSATVLSLKMSPTKRKPSGVRITYVGENKNKSHYGSYPTRDDKQIAGEALSLRAAFPMVDAQKTPNGVQQSPYLVSVAQHIYEFLTKATIESRGSIVPTSSAYLYKSLAGTVIDAQVETFDYQGNTSMQTMKFFVLEDEIDTLRGIHNVRMLSTATVSPPTRSAFIIAPSVALSTIRADLIVYNGGETVTQVVWHILNESGSVIYTETKTNPSTMFYFDYNPNASYGGRTRGIRAQVYFSPSGSITTSNTVTISKPNTPPNPINVPLIPIDNLSMQIQSKYVDELNLSSGSLKISPTLSAALPSFEEAIITNADFTSNINGWSVQTNDPQMSAVWVNGNAVYGFDSGSCEMRFIRDTSITMTQGPWIRVYQDITLPSGTEGTYGKFEAAITFPGLAYFRIMKIRVIDASTNTILKEGTAVGQNTYPPIPIAWFASIRFKIPTSRSLRIEFFLEETQYNVLNSLPNGTTYYARVVGCRIMYTQTLMNEYSSEGLRVHSAVGTVEISRKKSDVEVLRTMGFVTDLLASTNADLNALTEQPYQSARIYYDATDSTLKVAFKNAAGVTVTRTINVS